MSNVHKQIYQMLEDSDAIRHLMSFRQSVEIFRRNGEELVGAIRRLEEPYVAIAVWEVRNRDVLGFVQRDIGRLLHNFVASAKSFREHARIMVETEYAETHLKTDLKVELAARFQDDGLAQFVTYLRNNYLHAGVIPTTMEITFSNVDDEKGDLGNHLYLTRAELLKTRAFRWSDEAREFIRSQEESFLLVDVVESFISIGLEFAQWFEAQLQDLHADVHERLSELIKERDVAEFPQRVREFENMIGRGVAQPEQIFLGFVEPALYRSILSEHLDPIDRAEALLAHVRKRIEIDERVVAEVIALFESKSD